MGACASADSEGGNQSSNISKKGQKESEFNIILLGTHQSGKTTIARQLMFAHGAPMTDMERQYSLSIINNNIVNTIQTLCLQAHQYGSITIDAEDAFQYFIQKCNSDVLDDVVVSFIRKLWNEQAIRATYENRHNFYLRNQHNVQFFLDKLQEVTSNDYVPSDEDVVRIAIRTTAFNNLTFQHNGLNVHLHDLGGLRSERQRWPQRLSNISAAFFTVNISEFDEHLLEDPTILRLNESIKLFSDLARNGYFNTTPIVLVFTHMDIFEEKIAARNLVTTFPDYTGPSHDVEQAKDWISQRFLSQQNSQNQSLNITTFFVNALDVDKVKKCVASLITKPANTN